MPKNILDTIVETKRKEIRDLHAETDLADLQAAANAAPPCRNFFAAVTGRPRRRLNVIAEIKRASPSAGVIREDFDPVDLARRYQGAGASALSILTDREYFQGDLEFLRAARQAVDLPILRKDFLLDEWQVYESRAAGADAILLIAAILPPGRLLDMLILATELRMTSLIEVHDADELLAVRSAVGFPHKAFGLLGINNRDLTTFQVDVGTTLRLAGLVDDEVPIVSESGIKTRQDVERLAEAGIRAVLVGETFMRSSSLSGAMDALLGPPTEG